MFINDHDWQLWNCPLAINSPPLFWTYRMYVSLDCILIIIWKTYCFINKYYWPVITGYKASEVVVLNENSVVVTQRKQMLTAWSSSSNLIWLRWETYILKVVFVEHHTHVYVSQRSQIQFEDEDHAIYMGFCWVTTTCLRWEQQPVTLWLYPVSNWTRWCKYNYICIGWIDKWIH